jgi:hypothetical protein
VLGQEDQRDVGARCVQDDREIQARRPSTQRDVQQREIGIEVAHRRPGIQHVVGDLDDEAGRGEDVGEE